jgi:hypothetical protein
MKTKNKYQVKFSDCTGNCKLLKYGQTIKEFAGVSQLLAYCQGNDIEIAIEDCICSTIKNY